jgi:hypothetical protein
MAMAENSTSVSNDYLTPIGQAWSAMPDVPYDTVRTVVLQPQADAQMVVDATLPADLPEAERQALRALILDELRRLHEGVLARYGLRPSQLQAWKDAPGL